MSDPKKHESRGTEAPEAAELSDDALESVAGGCQIGTSVSNVLAKPTVEPTFKLPLGLESSASEELF